MNKIIKILSSRLVTWALLMLLQIIWIISLFLVLDQQYSYIGYGISTIAVLIVLFVVNKTYNPSYKLAWSILILAIPVFGVPLYFLFGYSEITKKNRRILSDKHENATSDLQEAKNTFTKLSSFSRGASKQALYISKWSSYPVYENQEAVYYPSVEELWHPLLEELEKATDYIFMEFFIVSHGVFFDSILDILKKKVKQGVKVYFLYDDMGSVSTVKHDFDKEIQSYGIFCKKFNPLKPIVSVVMNNRDHRKIIVVDGKVAFTGGFNLSDEYVNEVKRFGYWKDNGIQVTGPAVANFVSMFIEMWNYTTNENLEFKDYFPEHLKEMDFSFNGFIQPYADSPLDHENVGKNVYLNIINRAKDFVYISTPYLILDNEMTVALCNAAKSGVDVRIVTPGIPDKPSIFLLTRSNYFQLLEAGVKIFEYTPGFNHAKLVCCDDVLATVGTINFDYRSLYMHFENGVWMFRTSAVAKVKKDLLSMISESKAISYEMVCQRNWLVRACQGILYLFSPLL